MLAVFLAVAQAQTNAPGVPPDVPVRLDIPAQSLDQALTAYTNATALSALVDSRLTAGLRSTEVRGVYTPSAALLKLLAGTRLHVRYISNTAFTLTDAEPAAEAADTPGVFEAGVALRRYAAIVQRTVTRSLCHWQGREFGSYRAGLQLWIGRSGVVTRVALLDSTGKVERDRQLPLRLTGLLMDAAPPPALAQPITLLLTPRADAQAQCRVAGVPIP